LTDSLQLTVDQLIKLGLDDEVNNTDTGNGRRFVGLLRDYVRYAVDVKRWYLWNGRYWEPDTEENLKAFELTLRVVNLVRQLGLEISEEDDHAGRERMLKWAQASESINARGRMLTAAKANPVIQIKEEQFDSVETDLVVPNGVVDLRTGDLRYPTRADMNTRSCTVPYEPGTKSKELDRYLAKFLPDELDQRFVFALLGRCLIAGNMTRTFPIILGGTTSGKSQLMAAIHKIMGTYACAIGSTVFRGNLDDKPRPDLVKAMYTRLAYATEANKGWALHADQVKRLTGGDALPYRNHYGQLLNAYPRFTPLLVTNEMPRITGADTATRRRIVVVTFDQSLSVGEEDPKIKQRFLADEQCLKAILARLVEGARDDLMASIDHIPQKYLLATMNATGALTNVEEFLLWMYDEGYLYDVDVVETPVSHCVKASQLYDWYAMWVKKYGDHNDKKDILNQADFGRALKDKGWEKRDSAGARWLGRKISQLAMTHGIFDQV
jgi:putative DNA primase/helicase